jgi:hypothetical protein
MVKRSSLLGNGVNYPRKSFKILAKRFPMIRSIIWTTFGALTQTLFSIRKFSSTWKNSKKKFNFEKSFKLFCFKIQKKLEINWFILSKIVEVPNNLVTTVTHHVYSQKLSTILWEWKGINRKQSTRWHHLSRLKASAFFSLQNFLSCYETQLLILGTGTAIWWVTEPHCKLSYA